MAASKASVIKKLSEVKNLGTAYATKAYEDLGVRSIDDLIEAASSKKLQTIKGIGAAKEKAILASAREIQGADAPAPTPEKKKGETAKKSTAKKTSAKKSAAKKAADKKPAAKKAEAKKPEPKPQPKEAEAKKAEPKKAEAKKPEPAKAATSSAASSSASPKSSNGSNGSRQRTTYRPPTPPRSRPSIPGLLFKLGKKIIGRLLG